MATKAREAIRPVPRPAERARVVVAVAPASPRAAAFSPAAMQRRFGNQGAQAVLQEAAARGAVALPPAAAEGTAPKKTAPADAAAADRPVPEAPATGGEAGGSPPMTPAADAAATPAAAAPPEQVPAGEAPQPRPAADAAKGDAGNAEAPAAAAAAAPAAEAPAPSPAEAVAAVAGKVRKQAGKAARTHAPPAAAAAAAQAAAIDPATEQKRGAAQETVAAIDAAETKPVDRQSFREQLRKALAAAVPEPRTEEHAEELKKTGAADASAALSGQLSAQTSAAAGGLDAAAEPGAEVPGSAIPAPPAAALVPEEAGPAPEPIGAAAAVPEPVAPPDFSEDRAPTDKAMADAGVSKAQMARSNEPDFTATVHARDGAEQQEALHAQQFGAGQAGILASQTDATGAMLAGGMGGIQDKRGGGLGAVAGKQNAAKAAEAAERNRITTEIERIKNATREDVVRMLDDMETSATKFFEAGLALAEAAYERAFDDAKGGAVDWLTTWGDDWKEHLDAAFRTARAEYDRVVSETIDSVADIVETRLALAKARVQQGRKEVDAFVAGLDKSVRGFGEEARTAIGADFDAMEGEIDAKRDAIVSSLADQYRESQKRVSALEEKLREANKSVWERIYDATVGIIKKIIAFKDFLLGLLARVAQVVSAIIDDPIGFLGNLIGGIMDGLDGFQSRIGEHLKKGLLGWLFGALEGAGLKIPETFDLKGIIDLVMQVLGLTWANIRRRAVKILGEETVAYLEKTWDIFLVLVREGPAGLWQMLAEKIGDIKDMILTQVGEWVEEKIIVAGIKWVLSLLNPVAAFIKACMAIYDIVKFFIDRAAQIAELINAIVNSLGAIVGGNVSAMATAIEGALAKMIPVAIGFLASLLGLGGISEKIRAVIAKLQAPVNAAIDWIIGKAKGMVKKAGAALFGKKGKKVEKKEDLDPKTAAEVQAAMAELHRVEKAKGRDGLSQEEAEATAQQVRKDNPVIKSIGVKQGPGAWIYVLKVNPGIEVKSKELVFPFTAAQIEEAKARAMEIARRHKRYRKRQRRAVGRMDDPLRVTLPTPGTAGVVGDIERTRYKKGQHGFASGEARAVEIGRGTAQQPIVVSKAKLKSEDPEKPNLVIHPTGASHRYTVAERKLAEKAKEYGLNQGQFMDALSFYRRRGQLPDALAQSLGPVRAADLRIRIANLLLIALQAEAFRLGDAQATAAVSLQTMANEAANNPDAEVSKEFLGTLGSKTAHGGEKGAPAGRRSESVAAGVTTDLPKATDFDEDYAARQVAHMEAYFRSDPSLFKRITTVIELAKHIARLIIEQLEG